MFKTGTALRKTMLDTKKPLLLFRVSTSSGPGQDGPVIIWGKNDALFAAVPFHRSAPPRRPVLSADAPRLRHRRRLLLLLLLRMDHKLFKKKKKKKTPSVQPPYGNYPTGLAGLLCSRNEQGSL
jgi:hypothetical protein